MNEPGGIGYDKARVDALEDQVAVDTAIIKSLRIEYGVMLEALEKIAAYEDDPYVLGPVNDLAVKALRAVSGTQK